MHDQSHHDLTDDYFDNVEVTLSSGQRSKCGGVKKIGLRNYNVY